MIAEASRVAGVKRLIHFSALNADANSPSRFLQSKVCVSLIPPHNRIIPPDFSYLQFFDQNLQARNDACMQLSFCHETATRLLSFTHAHRHLVRKWFVKHSQRQPSFARPIRLVLKIGSLTTMPD